MGNFLKVQKRLKVFKSYVKLKKHISTSLLFFFHFSNNKRYFLKFYFYRKIICLIDCLALATFQSPLQSTAQLQAKVFDFPRSHPPPPVM